MRFDYQQQENEERRRREEESPRFWTRWLYTDPVKAGEAARKVSVNFYMDCLSRMALVHSRFERFASLERKRHGTG